MAVSVDGELTGRFTGATAAATPRARLWRTEVVSRPPRASASVLPLFPRRPPPEPSAEAARDGFPFRCRPERGGHGSAVALPPRARKPIRRTRPLRPPHATPPSFPESPRNVSSASPAPSLASCRPQNGCRPLDWRWRLGTAWHELGRKPPWAGRDPGVARVRRFLDAVRDGRPRPQADPGLAEAEDFRHGPAELVAVAESRLIAGATDEEVAARTGLSVPAAAAFAQIYCEVRGASASRLAHVAVRLHAPPDAGSPEFLAFVRRLVAFGLGTAGLDWLDECEGPLRLPAATVGGDAEAALAAALDERYLRRLGLSAWVASATWRPVTPLDHRIALRLLHQLRRRERSARRRQGRIGLPA